MGDTGQILLINPWICDFAAYNLFAEPVGLLIIAAALRDHGYSVTVLDCLVPSHGALVPCANGSGRFQKTVVPKPEVVSFVPRRYSRYGMAPEAFEAELERMPRPDVILITSGMTYWYPGVAEAILRLRSRFGLVPLALGGVYASLCPDHAREHSGADYLVEGPGVKAALELVAQVLGRHLNADPYADPRTWPPPAHELVARPYVGLVTSWGCPFQCTYCASHRLQPDYLRRSPEDVVREIAAAVNRGVHDFAFYDDALLVGSESHLVPILEAVIDRSLAVRFHTPNGMHASAITAGLASLMRRAGFASIRLSLETIDAARQQSTGGKVSTDAFTRAVGHLRAAGFGPAELGAYLLAGLPDQPLSEVEDGIRFVQQLGVQAKLALFSPIPGTPDGDLVLPYGTDPLLHNNSVRPYLQGEQEVRELQRIKQLAKDGNDALVCRT